MADLHLPPTLPSLFVDLPRRLDVDATTVSEAIDRLDERWPGLRDRLCEPGPALRPHINVYVDRERAELATALRARLAGRCDRGDQRRLISPPSERQVERHVERQARAGCGTRVRIRVTANEAPMHIAPAIRNAQW